MKNIGISKETFCKCMRLIKEQKQKDDDFSDALEKMGDGFFIFNTDNKYLEALLICLKESIKDKYDYISWWLYEAPSDNKIVSLQDNSKKWNLNTPEALYDFITMDCD